MTRTLNVTTPAPTDIVVIRHFDAPRPLVWRALTEPALLKRWLIGPDGWTMPVCEIDLRVGGTYRFVWRHQAKGDMGMSGEYRVVDAPVTFTNTEVFDEAWYDGECVVTQTLSDDGDETELTVLMHFISEKARDMALQSGMTSGIDSGYQRLDGILTEL
ncbi:SRPBCC family protein [Asticcacaulis sp. YBE204]|uniref:SRPBCC family protein n=1 Tax=Asticcacaulis sp. YBE204 TaxID=1282363 RepID=UPI0003C4087D|nr:SRPBCC family protein [Asticcacaulis sp. YBE204]ESQ80007.1 hypothetical protein AEYBE204_09160 [Asticcacaulis sp. YBE204]